MRREEEEQSGFQANIEIHSREEIELKEEHFATLTQSLFSQKKCWEFILSVQKRGEWRNYIIPKKLLGLVNFCWMQFSNNVWSSGPLLARQKYRLGLLEGPVGPQPSPRGPLRLPYNKPTNKRHLLKD